MGLVTSLCTWRRHSSYTVCNRII